MTLGLGLFLVSETRDLKARNLQLFSLEQIWGV